MDKITRNDDNNIYVMDDWEGPTTYVIFIQQKKETIYNEIR